MKAQKMPLTRDVRDPSLARAGLQVIDPIVWRVDGHRLRVFVPGHGWTNQNIAKCTGNVDDRSRICMAWLAREVANSRTTDRVRVLIADDHGVVRDGLIALLQAARDIEVVGAVGRADELRATLERTRCDILLLDLQLDRWMTNEIGDLAKLARVVVLTGTDRAQDMVDAFRCGARGIVQKTFAAETVKEAIRAVANGMVWMPPTLRKRLMARAENEQSEALTPREVEIVRQVAVGLRNAEVASNLSISVGTVKIHLNNIFNKLNIRDRVELTLYALRNRLIAIPERRD